MKKYFIKSTVIIALILTFIAAFTNLTYAEGNSYKKGERSAEIAEIQKALKDLKLFDEVATGYFGEVTEEAVKKFQVLHKLTPDGVVGPGTLKALFGKSSISNTTSRSVIERKKVNVPYTIKEGDTIWDIADEFNVTRDSILKYNNLTENSVLKIGQKITIPNVVKVIVKMLPPQTEAAKPEPVNQPTTETIPAPAPVTSNNDEILADLPDNIYVVKEGDTLYSIAEDYGVAVKALAEFNGLSENAILEIDKELKIPEAAATVADPPPSASTDNAQLKGEYLNWFDEVQYIFEKNDVATVTDIKTGKSFKVKRLYGRNHADVEPLTKEDAATMKSIYGSWSWDRRAVIVAIDGKNIAGSMNGMPHGGQQINNNDFQGHFCIH
ncbi:MAG: glycosyl hydrolase, partial [Clostridia bacterium]|nr:glycosyl hydrolase [Clostridia bacterium]